MVNLKKKEKVVRVAELEKAIKKIISTEYCGMVNVDDILRELHCLNVTEREV